MEQVPEITGEIRNDKGQFVPGVSGNPNGRPKGSYSIVEMIKKKLEELPEGKDKTYGEYFVEQIMKKTVIEGDVTMMRDIINRIDGMPKQSVDVTTDGEKLQSVDLDAILSTYARNNNKTESTSGKTDI